MWKTGWGRNFSSVVNVLHCTKRAEKKTQNKSMETTRAVVVPGPVVGIHWDSQMAKVCP